MRSLTSRPPSDSSDAKAAVSSKVAIELNDDWEGSQYRYCNEFLFHANDESFDRDAALAFLATMGDCELLVGEYPDFKVHVHSNTPDKVLAYMLERGQILRSSSTTWTSRLTSARQRCCRQGSRR